MRSETETKSDVSQLLDRFMNRAASEDSAPSPSPSPAFIKSVAEGIAANELQECAICLDTVTRPLLLSCGHVFCHECLSAVFGANGKCACPTCRCEVSFTDAVQLSTTTASEDSFADFDYEREWKDSSKTKALLAELLRIRAADASAKSVIFTQWTSMLDFCALVLKRNGFKFARLDGSMAQAQRDKMLRVFAEDPETTVFLVSLKAGGVGLNLVTARHVLFLDQWWNPAVEDQAIQRVHRIGQVHDVFVKRFVIRDTVEERMLELKARKKTLVQGALGMSEEESKKMKLDDLFLLFQPVQGRRG